MKKDENIKLIKDVLFQLLGQLESFDEVEYKFFKAFNFMYDRVDSFKKLSVVTQYQIVECVLFIDIGTTSKANREARILTRPKPSELEIKYSLSYGFENPEKLELKNRKLLKGS